jgi:alkanesulfonate monooxygenase SsuD/methylene tetrahydromethanopterin reductase-like flavin-dependent oxidoreductase (luciferase family)
MIKYFSALYAGHIEMEGVGHDGTPANNRRYPNERLITAYDNAKAFAQRMEEQGYDILWTAEHHFQREGYECIPNVLMLSLWLAQHTQRLKFGCAFNIAPMWHPIRLAEDFAMVDILTNGRVIFGVGRGYHTREVETFGAPMLDADANRALFEEQVEILLKAFNAEAFSHQGRHYTLPPEVPYRGYQLKELTLVPRPLHRPVEIWQPVVSGSPRGLDFMAKHGIKGMILGTAMPYVDQWVRQYQEANARYGRHLELGEGLALGFWLYLDKDRERAERGARPYFEEHVKFAAPLGMLRYDDDQMKAVGPGGIARHIAASTSFEEVVQKRVWLCGPPDEALAHLKAVEERYPGLEHIVVASAMGMPRALFEEQLTRLAEEVMPAFRAKVPA